MDIIGIKPHPGDHESNFKKVGAIPSKPFLTPDLTKTKVLPWSRKFCD